MLLHVPVLHIRNTASPVTGLGALKQWTARGRNDVAAPATRDPQDLEFIHFQAVYLSRALRGSRCIAGILIWLPAPNALQQLSVERTQVSLLEHNCWKDAGNGLFASPIWPCNGSLPT